MFGVAVLCGGGLPPPVLSYHSVMVLQFTSDSSIAHRGFRATLTFISHTGECQVENEMFLPNSLIVNTTTVISDGIFRWWLQSPLLA